VNQAPASSGGEYKPAIMVLEVLTGKTWKIADGDLPAWSPSGDWIAYRDGSQNSRSVCMAVHPDGTGAKTLVAFPHGKAFIDPPVWSPDSKTLLFNELADDEKWTMDIDLLDISALKLTKKFRGVPPVYAWAETK
jgi:Tol biopolymer transport system component